MKKTSLLLITLFLFSAFFVNFAQAADDSTLTIGFEADVSNLDPGFGNISVNERVISLIFDGLVEYGKNNKIVPGIAKSWDISDDGKTYTFYLRHGIKFHNGEELTASDVKFTYDRILAPDSGSGLQEKVTIIKDIEVINDYKIKFTLKNPYSPFLLSMTFGIVPKDYVEKIGADEFSRKPIGAGPFKLEEWVPDTKIVLTANENYWMKKPNLDKVIIRPIPESSVQAMELRSGGIDVAVNLGVGQLKSLKGESDFVIKSAPGGGVHFFGFNQKMVPYNNPEFKKAILMASPLDAMVPQVYGPLGARAYSFVPPTIWPDDRTYLKNNSINYNPAKAKKLVKDLKKKGIIDDNFKVEIYVPNSNPSRVKVVEALVTSLRQIGFKAEAKVMEFGTMWDKLGAGQVGIYMISFVSDPDPDYWLYRWFKSDGSLNKSFYQNKQVDNWLEKAKVSSDQKEREKLYTKVLRKTLVEDRVVVPVAHMNQIYVMNKNVKGLKPGNPLIIPLVTPEANVSISK